MFLYQNNKIYILQLSILIHKTCIVCYADLPLAAGKDIINRYESGSKNERNIAITVELVISQSLLKTALQSLIFVTPAAIQQ